MRRYCNHICSCQHDCWHDCDCDGWMDNCPHHEVCDNADDCGNRHEDCRCVEPHETAPECLAWLRENPPDVDVRTDDD